MGCMNIEMAPPRTGAGDPVGDKIQEVVRGLGEGSLGQGHLSLRTCPLRGPKPLPPHQCKTEDSGIAASSLVHSRETLEPLRSQHREPEGGTRAQGPPVRMQMNHHANWTPLTTRYEDMGRATVGCDGLNSVASCSGGTHKTHLLFLPLLTILSLRCPPQEEQEVCEVSLPGPQPRSSHHPPPTYHYLSPLAS